MDTQNVEEAEVIEWHVWVIRPGRFKQIKEFIQKEVPQVIDIMYPQIRKQRIYHDKIVVKDEPQFMNYMFVSMLGSDFHTVENKFKNYSHTTTYVGSCEAKDLGIMEKVREVQSRREASRDFFVGEKVRIIGGPFKDFKAVINEIHNHDVLVEIDIFNRKTTMTVPKNYIDLAD